MTSSWTVAPLTWQIPLSIRRAYTPAELDSLLHEAGIDDAEVTTHPWFRMAAVKTTPNGHA